MARPGIYRDLEARPMSRLAKVVAVIAAFALFVWALHAALSGPVMVRGHMSGKCIAVEFEGKFHGCDDARFKGKNMDSVNADEDMTLERLQQAGK